MSWPLPTECEGGSPSSIGIGSGSKLPIGQDLSLGFRFSLALWSATVIQFRPYLTELSASRCPMRPSSSGLLGLEIGLTVARSGRVQHPAETLTWRASVEYQGVSKGAMPSRVGPLEW